MWFHSLCFDKYKMTAMVCASYFLSWVRMALSPMLWRSLTVVEPLQNTGKQNYKPHTMVDWKNVHIWCWSPDETQSLVPVSLLVPLSALDMSNHYLQYLRNRRIRTWKPENLSFYPQLIVICKTWLSYASLSFCFVQLLIWLSQTNVEKTHPLLTVNSFPFRC